jgi:hypothetical protein
MTEPPQVKHLIKQLLQIPSEAMSLHLLTVMPTMNCAASTHKKAWANATDSYSEPFIRKNANKKTWIFNEETCEYNPPVPAPSDMSDHGKVYEWDDDTLSWIYLGG